MPTQRLSMRRFREKRHCLLTGPTGTGKSWLACALGHKACRENLSVFYQRASRFYAALALARGDGRYAKLLSQLARVDLLINDDWGPEPLLAEQQRDLLEIIEDRYGAGSLIITSQVPVDHWYEIVGKGSGLSLVEDCQQHGPAVTPRAAFMITGIGVHDQLDCMFTIHRNAQCPPTRKDTSTDHLPRPRQLDASLGEAVPSNDPLPDSRQAVRVL